VAHFGAEPTARDLQCLVHRIGSSRKRSRKRVVRTAAAIEARHNCRQLQRNDKQFDLMYYPTARHGVTNPYQVKHWYTMMTDFIQKNL